MSERRSTRSRLIWPPVHILMRRNMRRCIGAPLTIPTASGRCRRRVCKLVKKWDKVTEWDFNTADIKWFLGGKLNVSYNCLDRHLATRGDQTAIIWESDDPNVDKKSAIANCIPMSVNSPMC